MATKKHNIKRYGFPVSKSMFIILSLAITKDCIYLSDSVSLKSIKNRSKSKELPIKLFKHNSCKTLFTIGEYHKK